MSDQLFDGRPIRILTVVDIHTREGLSTADSGDVGILFRRDVGR
ncbi:hypothetical protein FHS87_004525 [Roseomonas pecuniae]|uniref:Uncharacterized protein n=1 Tax=Muricoccus pecuniae TaxID=693023 RepID=A0A840YND1_9PROT|nr:hypothetical protein [Roseomonas pecuniae]